MKIITILSDFVNQYIPDFSENLIGYLLLGMILLFGIYLWRN